MTNAAQSQTVGMIVAERPGLSRVFQRFGIDFCCGGNVTLEQACRDRNIPVDLVRNALDEANAQPEGAGSQDWRKAPLAELCEHIVDRHHDYLRTELPRLGAMVAKVASVHGGRNPSLVELRSVFAGFAGELVSHMQKEEQILFPFIARLERGVGGGPAGFCGDIRNPISVMEHEHQDAGDALERMRVVTDGFVPPDWACNTYRALLAGLEELEADMLVHVHKENHILFPRAVALQSGGASSASDTEGGAS